MTINIYEMSRKELVSLKSDIEKILAKLHIKEKKDALAAAKKAAAEYGFSLDELTAKRSTGGASGTGSSAEPKFANPEDSSQTWTGKGRQPLWYKSAIASGKSEEDLAI